MSATDAIESVEFKSVLIETDKLPMGNNVVDLAPNVSNIDIYEHMDKPYLTAAIAYSDTQDIVSSMDIGGGERVEITLQSTRENSLPIVKKFYLDKIVAGNKVQGNIEYFIFHLIEDIGFISNLHNVNRSYSGTPTNIIKRVAKEYLGKELDSTNNSDQNMKVIVPNLNPLETMSWIKNRACTASGYPFYLLSTLVNDQLSFVDLQTILSSSSMNPDIPFSFSESTMVDGSPISTPHRRVIRKYSFKDAEDLYSLIQKGLVGSEYMYLDPTQNIDNKFTFDIQESVISLLKKDMLIDEAPFYSEDYKSNGKELHKYPSRRITQVGSTKAYHKQDSYQQSGDVSKYKLNVINRAVDQLMKKNPMTMLVNGIDFLDGTSHLTIGRKLTVRFLRNLAPEDTDYFFDNKKSGDFLIFSAKHSFDRETYMVSLSCVKLDNGDVT